MKFFWYFFLILKIEIKGESLSFINLIPSIISHNRFIEENIIHSDIIFNSTFSSLIIDLILNANGSNCSRDIQLLSRDFNTKQTWALKSNCVVFRNNKNSFLFYFSIRCLG
jgi:hypothetical protein